VIFVVAECERKETVMTDAEEEVFIVEDPEEENKRETLLRNGEVRIQFWPGSQWMYFASNEWISYFKLVPNTVVAVDELECFLDWRRWTGLDIIHFCFVLSSQTDRQR